MQVLIIASYFFLVQKCFSFLLLLIKDCVRGIFFTSQYESWLSPTKQKNLKVYILIKTCRQTLILWHLTYFKVVNKRLQPIHDSLCRTGHLQWPPKSLKIVGYGRFSFVLSNNFKKSLCVARSARYVRWLRSFVHFFNNRLYKPY